MSMLEQVPAVRRLDVSGPNLHAFDVVGHVSSADIENLFGLLEAAYALNPRIDILLRLIDNQGFDWEDVASDTMLQGKADARQHVGKCAVIGTPTALSASDGFFLDAKPVDYRQFLPDDEAEAWGMGGCHPA